MNTKRTRGEGRSARPCTVGACLSAMVPPTNPSRTGCPASDLLLRRIIPLLMSCLSQGHQKEANPVGSASICCHRLLWVDCVEYHLVTALRLELSNLDVCLELLVAQASLKLFL